MAVIAKTILAFLDGEKRSSGNPAKSLKVAYGGIALALGAASENVSGFTGNAAVFATYIQAGFVGGNAGILRASYNPATGAVDINSTNGADGNSVQYVIVEGIGDG